MEAKVAFLLAEGKGQAWKLDSAISDPEPEHLDLAVLLCLESQKPQLSLDKGPGTVGDICNSVYCDRKMRTEKGEGQGDTGEEARPGDSGPPAKLPINQCCSG